MGQLARYLANAFREQIPREWEHSKERRVLPEAEQLTGYSPRADVCLTRSDGSRRVWIEFEISRADPVANHVKFAVAHGFAPQPAGDAFLSMMSAHVARGKRRIASASILLMRHVGMTAFQTVLLPQFSGDEIQTLNQLNRDELARRELPIGRELDRALRVVEPIVERPRYRVHFASGIGEVMMNTRRWNDEMNGPGATLWGKRRVQYFVHDSLRDTFAPSKFCAFTPIPGISTRPAGDDAVRRRASGFVYDYLMSMALYVDLDESEPRFDGHRARKHLERKLCMKLEAVTDAHELAPAFDRWLRLRTSAVAVRGTPHVLRAPPGFR